jgi:DNA-directed RNA polymerase subunit beta
VSQKIQYDRLRYSYSRYSRSLDIPSLVDLQRSSYEHFLCRDAALDKREGSGIYAVLKNLFSIEGPSKGSSLEFLSYRIEDPVYSIDESRKKGLTYGAALRAKLRLTLPASSADEEKIVRDQEVYLGDFPIMTKEGTFVVGGVERVIVSQLHRSPGIFFDVEKGSYVGRKAFTSRITPSEGSWLDFEFDAKNIFYIRIDRKRKIPVTTFLAALPSEDCPDDPKVGMSREEILSHFYQSISFALQDDMWRVPLSKETIGRLGVLAFDLVDADSGRVLLKKGQRISSADIEHWVDKGAKGVLLPFDSVVGCFLSHNIVNEMTGELVFEAGKEILSEDLDLLKEFSVSCVRIVDTYQDNGEFYLHNTLVLDKVRDRSQALFDIHRTLRPGERSNFEGVLELFNNLFFNPERYSLSEVGRLKINQRLGLDLPLSLTTLCTKDIFSVVRYMLDLRRGKGYVDDIDSLTNRRVRAVGELLSVQFRSAVPRMKRSVRERMASMDAETVVPSDLINSRPLSSLIREFFGSFQLSQFMDQTNPLSEFNHKRRLSALGPGGVTRDRASIEIRDVHPTHYGRICPVETPEGSNIGLISSLAVYVRINKYGFLETPYRRVVDGIVTDEVVYVSPLEEGGAAVAQADSEMDEAGKLQGLVGCRRLGEYVLLQPNEVDFMDVAPKQILSLAGSLIPFLENNDASRALMGANMMRQAVPLVRCQAPLVGTGSERLVVRDSGVSILAKRSGIVDQANADRIVVRPFEVHADEGIVDVYHLEKFRKSNDGTCICQKALCVPGDHVEKGDILADGSATFAGDLALGRNVKVAFAMMDGLGFEDSIILSQSLVDDDAFTSVHITSLDIVARDTKLGSEEICFDVPFASEESTRHLDEAGIVSIGSKVGPGDVLVGRVSPKAEAPLTAEEKLLRAIFSGKAADMKDTSLRVPPGVFGTVVDVRVSVRRGTRDEDLDERTLAIRRHDVAQLLSERDTERTVLFHGFRSTVVDLLSGQKVQKDWGRVGAGKALSKSDLEKAAEEALRKIVVKDEDIAKDFQQLLKEHDNALDALGKVYQGRMENLLRGDDLPPGVLKKVEVFLAIKRKIQVGDKMAGRHGNKGVVSAILPREDMPILDDGTRVEVVLNPLGLPSRMNVGQIYETHTGYACLKKGEKIKALLAQAFQDESGGETLLRQGLKQICNDTKIGDFVDTLNCQDLVKCARVLTAGVPISVPAFEGLSCEKIGDLLEDAGANVSGQEWVRDGRTGVYLDRPVTVGVMYMLKLHHLVDEKIHARSVGPYSLVTQQPLGGRSQFGGQRLGEMEVWALEAYAACITLLEMLTIKSDDIKGRTEAYKNIVHGVEDFSSENSPESWNVLVKELQTLGINVETADVTL